jgi:pyrroline-5-carboxylate reductase
MSDMGRLAIIGAGAMGSAFAGGVISSGLFRAEDVVVSDVDEARLTEAASAIGVATTSDNVAAVRDADVVIVAVKPAMVREVLSELTSVLTERHLVISLAAGVRLEAMESVLPEGVPVIRTMPNTPCLIREGAIGFSRGRAARPEHAAVAKRIFDAVGISFEVPEKLLNAVTGLSGSGPAYIYVLIEALSDAGVRVGLPRDIATKLASQTVKGAAQMVLDRGEHPAKLKDQVTSPGGTTIAALDTLEHAGFRSALIEAVKAATRKADELG